MARQLSAIDHLIGHADRALRTIVPGVTQAQRRPNNEPTQVTPAADPQHTAGLMRINHTGEVCAQALYQGQALTAKLPDVRQKMEQAAQEEEDHLAWCEERLTQLGSRPSYLNPAFYALSFMVGAAAGLAGDKWSLGFVAETEKQVVKHLEGHLAQIPDSDQQTRSVLLQMREDELHHATNALEAGGADLPLAIQNLMTLMSKVMTWSTYRI